MSTDTKRTGRGIAAALAIVELAVLALIWLSWASSYWSWDPQHYGAPPGPYLQKAVFVPAAALVAAAAAGFRGVRTVAISQLVLSVAICGILTGVKARGERVYESSYRDACHSGLVCDAPPPTP